MSSYEKQNFKDGEVLTAEHLNKLEQFIFDSVQPDELKNYYSLENLIALTKEEILKICK